MKQEYCNSCILSVTNAKQEANVDSASDIDKVQFSCTLCDIDEMKSLFEFSNSFLDATEPSVEPSQGLNKIGDAVTADNEDDDAIDVSE